MATAANGQRQAILAPEVHSIDHVGCAGRTHNERWPLVDHPIVDLAGFVVGPQGGFRLTGVVLEPAQGVVRTGQRALGFGLSGVGGQKLFAMIDPSSQDFTGQGTGSVEIRVREGDTLSDIARTLVDHYSDGVWLVELAPVTDPAEVSGTVLGALGLRARDVFFLANLVVFSLLLFCGVNVPFDSMPGWVQAIGRCLPLTHGIMAARQIADGASLSDVSDLVWTELGIGAAYAAGAFALFKVFELEGRRRASFESI